VGSAVTENQLILQLAPRLRKRRRIDPECGCWLWQGGKDRKGYGRIWFAGRVWRVHVLGLCVWGGRSPRARGSVGHTCGEPACFNPCHLLVARNASVLARRLRKHRSQTTRQQPAEAGERQTTEDREQRQDRASDSAKKSKEILAKAQELRKRLEELRRQAEGPDTPIASSGAACAIKDSALPPSCPK